MIDAVGAADDDEPERLHADAIEEPRSGPLGLLRDLQDLYLLASLTDVTWTMVEQAGPGAAGRAAAGDRRGLREGDVCPAPVADHPDEAGRPAGPDRGEVRRRS